MTEETLRILLVEDDDATAELIEHALEKSGALSNYEVTRVGRLADAIASMQSRPSHLVLLDVGLPDSDGLRTFTRFHSAAERTPTLVLTSNSDEALALDCMHAGAQDYLEKRNLQGESLARSIRYALGRTRVARAREREREVAQYRTLSSDASQTSVTSRLAGVGPLKDRDPKDFRILVAKYRLTLDTYLERRIFGNPKPQSMMQELVSRLGDVGSGPRDLLDVHLGALDLAVEGLRVDRADAMAVEGRLFALELMGFLVDYYRIGTRYGVSMANQEGGAS